MGVLPRQDAVELYDMYKPLTDYLSDATGERVSIVIPKDFEAFKAAVRKGQLDICHSNPLVYVQLRGDAGVVPLVVSLEPKSGGRFRGVIVARKDSGINSLGDLKGRKLAFVDRDSAGGFLFQMLLLKEAGLDVHRDFVMLPFVKKHGNVLRAVYHGAADAGGLREGDLSLARDKDIMANLKVVSYTDFFPGWPVYASPALKPETAVKIKTALLRLNPKNRRDARILDAARLAGFAQIADGEYDKLRDAARQAGILEQGGPLRTGHYPGPAPPGAD